MSLSKFSLLAAAAAISFSGVAAHADSLSLGNPGGSFSFTFEGNHENAAGGNMTGTSAVIGGKTVDFAAVYCVDLNDEIGSNSFYNHTTFTKNGVVNGSTVHNAADIAWLLLNITATTTTQSEGLQAAIWEEEYGNAFSVSTFGQSGIIAERTLLSPLSRTLSTIIKSRRSWSARLTGSPRQPSPKETARKTAGPKISRVWSASSIRRQFPSREPYRCSAQVS